MNNDWCSSVRNLLADMVSRSRLPKRKDDISYRPRDQLSLTVLPSSQSRNVRDMLCRKMLCLPGRKLGERFFVLFLDSGKLADVGKDNTASEMVVQPVDFMQPYRS